MIERKGEDGLGGRGRCDIGVKIGWRYAEITVQKKERMKQKKGLI